MDVYNTMGNKYGVADIPIHRHDGVDTPNIPPTSVTGFQNLPATSGGIASPGVLGDQGLVQGSTNVGYGYLATGTQAVFPVFPLVIVAGHGTGDDGSFNGGNAPVGSLIFFQNGTTLSGLWVKGFDGTWYGIAQGTIGYNNLTM